MPPKVKIRKEDIFRKAFALVQREGEGVLNARRLAAEIGCSTQPIYSHYRSMNELRQEIIAEAKKIYAERIFTAVRTSDTPYKASGLAYIAFASEEPQLFRLLFMRDRGTDTEDGDAGEIEPLLDMLQEKLGVSREEALLFHVELWTVCHGIATMIVTRYYPWKKEEIDRVLNDSYRGIAAYYKEHRESNGSNPNREPDKEV